MRKNSTSQIELHVLRFKLKMNPCKPEFVKKAGRTGRLSVCLVFTGLFIVIQGSIMIIALGSYTITIAVESVLIMLGFMLFSSGIFFCVLACVKVNELEQSSSGPSIVTQVN